MTITDPSLPRSDNNDYPPDNEHDSDNIVVKLPAHKAAFAMQSSLQENSGVPTKKRKPTAPRTYSKHILQRRSGAPGLSRSLEGSPASKTLAQEAAAAGKLASQPALLCGEKPTTPPSTVSTTTAGEQAHRALRGTRSTPVVTARTDRIAHSAKPKTTEKRKPNSFAPWTKEADKQNAHADIAAREDMADMEDEEIQVKSDTAEDYHSSAEQNEHLDNGDEDDEDTIKVERPSKAARKGKLPRIPHD
ncbi:Hypothetical predicted protein, partial [Lecanosticta acicola]